MKLYLLNICLLVAILCNDGTGWRRKSTKKVALFEHQIHILVLI